MLNLKQSQVMIQFASLSFHDWVARVYFPNRYFHIDHNASCLQWLLKNLGGKQGAIWRN